MYFEVDNSVAIITDKKRRIGNYGTPQSYIVEGKTFVEGNLMHNIGEKQDFIINSRCYCIVVNY